MGISKNDYIIVNDVQAVINAVDVEIHTDTSGSERRINKTFDWDTTAVPTQHVSILKKVWNNLLAVLYTITEESNFTVKNVGDIIPSLTYIDSKTTELATKSYRLNADVTPTKENTGCASECVGLCSGCKGTCQNTCTGTCVQTCADDCGGGCYTQCSTACERGCSSCSTGCGTTCKKGCADYCNGGCSQACSDVCGVGCSGLCVGSCEGSCQTGCGGCGSTCKGTCSTTCTATCSNGGRGGAQA